MYCLVYMYIFISECKRSVVHTWICLTKKNSSISSVYVFDGLYYRARRGSASKQQGEKSPLITILFSSKCHIILQTVPVSGKGKQTERAEQLQHNGNLTEATAAEINHHLLDLVCAFIEVSVGYRFCYVPNLSFKILYDVV